MSIAFDEIPSDSRAGYVALRENDATSYDLSSVQSWRKVHLAAEFGVAHSLRRPFYSYCRWSFVLLQSSTYPWVAGSVDELLCVTSDTTSSIGLCIGAEATIHLSFPFIFRRRFPLRHISNCST